MPDLFQLPEAVQTPWPLAPSPSRAEMLLLFFSCLSCPTVYDPMDCGTPDFPVLHHLPEFAQSHVLWVSDAIQPSHLSSVTPLLFLPSIFPSISVFSTELALRANVAQVLELQLQHRFFQ